ncbi:sigma factor-like helix-turn-helix DNA-binding protein [Mesomycoplasma hyorhinis]|uniref:Uncharacterized protein n=3 Tax=Mesomycoplasma hyorhinis TaxID=2100 RepID=A0ABD6IEG9_MESHY|nr:sigma factor-like helix-turn-helix DNA-binding protein [Mesomycoplasma hyorhinis]AEC45898.1 putative UPF0122 protein [Mesomycoplasma hyorhinis MCLD]AEX13891.1 hypothetical protein MYM_0088 [Mesomycoplasma hyorhinis GDL-1]AFX74029.1 hypothetical protein MOS_097 [Mesomycoplasma hyorhinis SK76]AHA40850.1 sigma-70, region 4 family protein [Mesomycoplasma hyorhinis DBS 1050]MBY7705466.1 hypothetical protein [Vibrio harveyi]
MNNNKELALLEKKEYWLNLFKKYSFLLTQNQKQVFHLYFVEDLSLNEVAIELAVTRSAVFDTLKKTKIKLEEIYKKHQN